MMADLELRGHTTDRTRRLLQRLRAVGERPFLMRKRYWADALDRYGHLPAVLRQAHCLAHTLDHMKIVIEPDELLLGGRESEPPPAEAVERFTRHHRQIHEHTLDAQLGPDIRQALEARWFTTGIKTGHVVPDYAAVLEGGIPALLAKNAACQARLDPHGADSYDRMLFHQALAVALEAALRFARRHAEAAARLAREEKDAGRARELRRLARLCRTCLAGRPRSFHEALQATWFIHLLVCIEAGESHSAFGQGRFDQYLWPFYAADRAAGRLTRDQAAELIDGFWIKLTGLGEIPQNMTLGGTTADGTDGTNELTYLCLDSTARLRTLNPSLTLRWNAGMPGLLKRRALELIRTGLGMPQLYNDALARATMERAGVAPSDTHAVVPCGCVELSIQGCCNPWVGNFFNLVKCLELALNNGVDPVTGRRLGLATGEPADLTTFDDLWAAFRRQMAHGLGLMVRAENLMERLAAVNWPSPLLSALVGDCMERHRDYWDGGARYNFNEIQAVGIANVVDSLAAVRRFVFERQELELTDLVAMLRRNFQGDGLWRRRLERQAPKYGNQVAEVDELAARLVGAIGDELARYRNTRGGPFVPGLLVWTLARDFGLHTGATPDGRRAGEVLSDSIGPAQGRDRLGPTATVHSVTRPDYSRVAGGLSFNLKFAPATLRPAESLDKLAALIDAYFKLGGLQIQLNVADADVLREAQRCPQQHADLIVRVSGWSARFVGLSREHQDEIIRRTAHGL